MIKPIRIQCWIFGHRWKMMESNLRRGIVCMLTKFEVCNCGAERYTRGCEHPTCLETIKRHCERAERGQGGKS